VTCPVGGAKAQGWKDGSSGRVEYAVRTAVSARSELVIFVPRAAHNHDLWLFFIVVAERGKVDP
jgi:hypothetical protein